MATSMKSVIKVEVAGAGTSSATHTVEVEAYDKIEVTVPGGSTSAPGTHTVEVQPGAAGQVELLLITADDYSGGLSYTTDGGSVSHDLDAPQLFVGQGAVGLLGAVQSIGFSNSGDEVGVRILVGRDATAPTTGTDTDTGGGTGGG